MNNKYQSSSPRRRGPILVRSIDSCLRGSDEVFIDRLCGSDKELGSRFRGNDEIKLENDSEVLNNAIGGGALPAAPSQSAARVN